MPRSGSAGAAAVSAPAAPAAAVPPAAAPEAAAAAAGGIPPSAGNSNSSAATSAAAAAAAALGRKLFVGGTGEVEDDTFRDHFRQFGEIEDCVVLRKEGVSRGFGFVTFADEASVERALAVTVRVVFVFFALSFLLRSTRGGRDREGERQREGARYLVSLLFLKNTPTPQKKN